MSRFLKVVIALIVLLAVFLAARFFNQYFSESPYNYEDVAQPIHNFSSKDSDSEGTGLQNWREFIAPYGHFKVSFPTLPQHVTDSVVNDKTKEVTKYNTFVSTTEQGAVYIVSAISFPFPIASSDAKEVLKTIVMDMLQRNQENKLQTMDYGNFREFQSLDFILTNDKAIISGKVLLHGDMVYVLSVIDSRDHFDKKKLEFFENSFDLASSPKEPPPTSVPAPSPAAVPPTAKPSVSTPR